MKGILQVVRHLIICLLSLNSVYAIPPVVFSSPDRRLEVGNAIELLEDAKGTLSPAEVLYSTQFRRSESRVPNLGITTHTYWVRLRVHNKSGIDDLIVELASPTIDEVVFYNQLPNGSFKEVSMGDRFPFWERKYNCPNYLFDLRSPANTIVTCLLKVKSSEQIQIPLYLGTARTVLEANATEQFASGLYFGLILAMFFYNLFLYLAVRDRVYLYYVSYIFFVGLTQAGLTGYAFKYIWPYSPWLAIHSAYLVPVCVGCSVAFFVRNFLQARRYTPALDKGLNGFLLAYIICAFVGLLGHLQLCHNLTQITAMLGSCYILYMGYAVVRKGYRPAQFFLLAWTIFLTGVCIFVLRNFNLFPYNTFTHYILQIGSAIEVVLLSFALADRINILKREKEASQIQVLTALKENERIIKEQNLILDTKVKERTRELQESNRELNIALKRLKEAQAQLVNAEKMASVGQLTAGIAHEINNPINFVSAAMKPLRRNIGYFLEVLDKYENTSLQPPVKNFFTEVEVIKKKYDIDYCKEEIAIILQGIEDGASRTTEIVKGLRNFSRLDEAEIKLANINTGLDSTIILLQGNINGRIKINKDYGEIPEIECYAGKLNQVFMNILTNGIQAVQAKGLPSGEGCITIQTRHTEKDLIIRFVDNGIGMTEEVKNKIFDPFFTTKEVGEGTGLGMSIVYSIIQMHEGSIVVDSEAGVGTQITLTIPKACVGAEK